MGQPKTKPEKASVAAFLDAIEGEARRKDCLAVAKLMQRATGAKPQMWGTSIVGFGNRRYQGRSGSTDWFLAGFSPRKQNLTLYIMTGFARYPALMKALGTYKTGQSCLYIKSLGDIDVQVLDELITESVKQVSSARE